MISTRTYIRIALLMLVCIGKLWGVNANFTRPQQAAFIPNRGQITSTNGSSIDSVLFVVENASQQIFLRTHGISYIYKTKKREGDSIVKGLYRFDVHFKNSLRPVVHSSDSVGAPRNYYVSGKVIENVRGVRRVRYINVYKGIDVEFTLKANAFKYDVIVQPGADESLFELEYPAGSRIQNKANKKYIVMKDGIKHTEFIPICYSLQQGDSIEIESQVSLIQNKNLVRFACANKPKTATLVIDPEVRWAQYFGGKEYEIGSGVVVDKQSNIYVGGLTRSLQFPVNPGQSFAGATDCFVVCYSSSGAIKWMTLLGGSRFDFNHALAVDSTNNVYIVGRTFSDDFTFVGTPNQPTNRSQNQNLSDGFIVKLNGVDGAQIWGTYYGETQDEEFYSVAVDAAQDVVVCGVTSSPQLQGENASIVLSKYSGGVSDAVVVKYRGATGKMLWSGLYGGNAEDKGRGIACAANNLIVIVGYTQSSNLNTVKPFQDKLEGTIIQKDAFVAALSSTGYLQWASYYGGSDDEEGNSVTVDDSKSAAYIVGKSNSTDLKFVRLKPVEQMIHGGAADVFVLRLNYLTGDPQWATYFGGIGPEVCYSSALGYNRGLVVSGFVDPVQFPRKMSQLSPPGKGTEFFFVQFDTSGFVNWASTFGGRGDEIQDFHSLAVDNKTGIIYACGNVSTSDFPVKGIGVGYQGSDDVVVMSICPSSPKISLNPQKYTICGGEPLEFIAPDGYTQFEWYRNNIKLPENTKNIVIKSGGVYKLRAALIGADCLGESDTVQIIQNLNPTPTINLARKTIHICKGDSVKLELREDSYTRYQWSNGVNAKTTFAKDTGIFYCMVTDRQNCTGSSDTVSIQYYASPVVTIQSSSGRVTNDTIDLCDGETTTLTVSSSSPISSYKWSRALEQTSSITVGSNLTVHVEVKDANSCSWTSDTITIRKNPIPVPTYTAATVSCIGSLQKIGTSVSSNQKISWSVAATKATIVSGKDSTTCTVYWNEAGSQNISLTILDTVSGCSKDTVFTVQVSNVTPKAKIANSNASTRLCDNETARLTVPSGFKNYLWLAPINSTHSTVVIRTLGTYILQFEDASGCIGADTITFTQKLFSTLDISPRDFDTVTAGQSKQIVIELTNNSIDSLQAEISLEFKQTFVIDSIVPKGAISTNEKVRFYISFFPKDSDIGSDSLKDFAERLSINILQPCLDSMKISLFGVGREKPLIPIFRFKIDNITTDVTSKNQVVVPVKAWLEQSKYLSTIQSVSGKVHFNPSMFTLAGSTQESFISFPSGRALSPIAFTIQNPKLSTDTTVLFTLRGRGVLGDRRMDSIKVQDITISTELPQTVLVESYGAEIVSTNFCENGDSPFIQSTKALQMLVLPHPVTDASSLHIQANEIGTYHITISTSSGELVHSFTFLAQPSQLYSFTLPTQQCSSGVYSVQLQTPTEILHQIFTVVR